MRFFVLVLALLPSCVADARWAIRPANVPTERLLDNTSGYIEENPKDPQGHYVLGRLHSMAFATAAEQLTVGRKFNAPENDAPLPDFLPYQSIKIQPNLEDGKLRIAGERLSHLAASVEHYRKAIELSKPKAEPAKPGKSATGASQQWTAKDRARALLGLAWMYEVASDNLPAINQAAKDNALGQLSPGERKSVATFLKAGDQWRQLAISTYRTAMEAAKQGDQQRSFSGPGADSLISLDAAQSIVRMLDGTQLDAKQQQLYDEMKKHIASMSDKGRVVTPIIFTQRDTEHVDQLLQPDRTVSFDLDGDGVKSSWPWVRSDTWLLVWDPKRTGVVKDGRQLFGSVTWWIYWNDGYEPLAALDDDRDGWLAGGELKGLSAWQDRDGNGLSEPGEVISLDALGVRRLAAKPAASYVKEKAIATHPAGLQWNDGRVSATYDWTPRSR